MNRRHTLLIAKYSARFSVRSGIGLVFLLLSMTFGLIVAHVTLQPVEFFAKNLAAQSKRSEAELRTEVLEQLTKQAKPVVAWMVSTKRTEPPTTRRPAGTGSGDESADAWAAYLLDDKPALLSAIFLILLFGWPLVVAFGAFDLYSGDIGSRQLRYQLLRADRGSIYAGRLLGTAFTFVAVLVLLGVTVTAYMGLKLTYYPWSSLIGWAAYCTVVLVVASLPYIALCAWLSAAVSSSFLSLTLASLVIGGVPLLAMFARTTHEAGGYLLYLLPWGFQTRLFHPEPAQVALAAGGCLLQAALFAWLGHRTFTTRDL